jgi:hypothetical protein
MLTIVSYFTWFVNVKLTLFTQLTTIVNNGAVAIRVSPRTGGFGHAVPVTVAGEP